MDALTEEELLALLRAAHAHSERDWLMILIAYRFGLRASEVLAITLHDLKDGKIEVQRLKGSQRTVQTIEADEEPILDLRAGLARYCRGFHAKQRLFPVARQHFWRIVQRHAATAGIPERKRHPHILKHTIAMRTIHDAGIENVRQFLGHKSIASTGMYLRVSDADAGSAVSAALRDSALRKKKRA